MSSDLSQLKFGPPVAYVYNPLDYAWNGFSAYLSVYGSSKREVLLLGMNPGPWGMAQTGIPFGEVNLARDWLGIQAEIRRPERLHPKRPVLGFACTRSEASGKRLWGWAKDTFGAADKFFARFMVLNYCPLMFLDKDGKNLTPDKLPRKQQDALTEICDCALMCFAEYYKPRHVIGLGKFAQRRAAAALAQMDIEVGFIPHPSPANPAANKGWGKLADASLKASGVEI
ncbi:MAG: uracil-DNA glycosylase family protein [Pseudomonadota bacterium]